MSDYYHQFLTSMSEIGAIPGTSPQDAHTPPYPGAQLPIAASAPPFQTMGYYPGYAEPMMYNAPKSQKSRRKGGAALESVKHRRTRSGCFTCRSRRVKCDEARPICDRCKKGNRDCVYPDPPPGKGLSSQGATSKDATCPTQQPSPGSSYEGDEAEGDAEREVKLETILDEDFAGAGEEESHHSRLSPYTQASPSRTGSANPKSLETRQNSETPSLEGNKSSPGASTETSSSQTGTTRVTPDHPQQLTSKRPDWSIFSEDVQRYMGHYYERITHHHYCIPHDGHDFFQAILPHFAAQNEALLNAVVGFSAYLFTLENRPNGKIQEFLQYYNRSVTLLLASLRRKDEPDVATLLTILQLATIEEYLGDWINLMGHQKAAYEILVKLFRPQSAVQTPLGRMVVYWYARFDVFVAIMGGFPTTLPQDWFTEYRDYCQVQVSSCADNDWRLHWKVEKELAQFRIITRAMSVLFARGSRGQIPPQEFAAEHGRLLDQLEGWKASWDPELVDPEYLVTDFSFGQPLNQDDIVDPYVPGNLYKPPKFATTSLILHWLSMMIMHKCQSPTTNRSQLYRELAGHALHVCQIFELIERWPGSPRGSLIAVQAPAAISALFVPQDEKHHMWFRRKLALFETKGYIFPTTLRIKIGELFRAPECARWWLPNDEGYTPILEAVRNLADERNAAAINAQQENLREVRHVFAKLELADDGGEDGGDDKSTGTKSAT